jgi:hypothetical protein
MITIKEMARWLLNILYEADAAFDGGQGFPSTAA